MKRIKVLMIGRGFPVFIHPRSILEANYQLRPRGLEFALECLVTTRHSASESPVKHEFARTATDWKAEIGKADLVCVFEPSNMREAMTLAALGAGKAIVLEAPLAWTLEETRRIRSAAKRAGSPTLVPFYFRGAPGALEARRLIQSGAILGKSGFFEGVSEFLQDWGRAHRPSYHYVADDIAYKGYGGIINDLGAFPVDLVQFVVGRKVVRVSAQTRVYVGEGEDLQAIPASSERGRRYPVDAFEAVGYFDDGSAIVFRSNRASTGHKAFFRTSLHGHRGGVQWELEDQGYLKYYSYKRKDGTQAVARERGWTHIHLSDPGPDGHLNTDTVPGLSNGFLQYVRWQWVHFGLQLLGKPDKTYTPPTFADACQVQAVCDAMYRSGLKDGELTKVAKV